MNHKIFRFIVIIAISSLIFPPKSLQARLIDSRDIESKIFIDQMIKFLRTEFNAKSEDILQIHDEGLERLFDEEDKEQLVELKIAREELANFKLQRMKLVEAKRRELDVLTKKVLAFTVKINNLQTEIREVERKNELNEHDRARVYLLKKETRNILKSMQKMLEPYLDKNIEAESLSETLKQIIAQYKNGSHITRKEISKIEEELDDFQRNKVEELESEKQQVNSIVDGFNNWHTERVEDFKSQADRIQELRRDLKNLVSELMLLQETYNEKVNELESCESVDCLDRVKEELDELIEEMNRSDREVKNLDKVSSALNEDLTLAYKEFENEKLRRENEIEHLKSSLKRRVKRTEKIINDAITNSDREIESLEEEYITELDNIKAEISEIKNYIRSGIGEKFKDAISNLNKLIADSNGSLKNPKAFNRAIIVGQVTPAMSYCAWSEKLENNTSVNRKICSLGMNAEEKIYQIKQKLEQLSDVKDKLKGLRLLLKKNVSSRTSLERNINKLELDVDKLAKITRKAILEKEKKFQELEIDIMTKSDERIRLYGELFKLKIDILKAEFKIISAILLNNEDLVIDDSNYETMFQSLKVKAEEYGDILSNSLSSDKFELIKHFEETEEVDHPSDPRWSEVHRSPIIFMHEVFNEKKAAVINQWYISLLTEDIFSDQIVNLANGPLKAQNSDKIIAALFRGGMTNNTIKRAVLASGRVCYLTIIDGNTYWINDRGHLKEHIIPPLQFEFIFEGEGPRKIISLYYNDFKRTFRDELGSLNENQFDAVVLAESLLREAFLARDTSISKYSVNIAKNITQLALSSTPVVGDGVDFYEFFTGKDIYGKKLKESDRILAAAGLFAGNRKFWSSILDGTANIYKKIKNSALLDNKPIIGKAEKIISSAGKWDNVKSLIHTVRGTSKIAADGSYKLVKGLHTKMGLDHFVKMNTKAGKNYPLKNVSSFETVNNSSDILKQTLGNGVTRVQLPRNAFSNSTSFNRAITGPAGNRVKGVKTLFPDNFDVSEIAKAGDEILKQNQESTGNLIKGVYKGIKVSVQKDSVSGKIISVYPSWIQ